MTGRLNQYDIGLERWQLLIEGHGTVKIRPVNLLPIESFAVPVAHSPMAAFSRFDPAGDGVVPRQYLGNALRLAGWTQGEVKLKCLLLGAEGKLSSSVDFADFQRILSTCRLP